MINSETILESLISFMSSDTFIAALVGMLFTLLGFWLKSKISNHNDRELDRLNADRARYHEVISICPQNSSAIELIKLHDFRVSFAQDSLRPLERLLALWEQDIKRYHDKEIDKLRADATEKLKVFLDEVSRLASPINGGFLNCLPCCERGDDIGRELSPQTNQDLERLHQAASEAHASYQSFIATAKERLSV